MDKKICWAMAQAELTKVKDIRDCLGMPSNKFSIYRERLIRKGVLVSPSYGVLEFALPMFNEYVISQIDKEAMSINPAPKGTGLGATQDSTF